MFNMLACKHKVQPRLLVALDEKDHQTYLNLLGTVDI